MPIADRYLRTLENHEDTTSSYQSPKKGQTPVQSPVKSPARAQRSPVKSKSPAHTTSASPVRIAQSYSPVRTARSPLKTPTKSPMRSSLPVITPTQTKERKKLILSENGPSLDQERRNLQAYEYLCHVGEAHQWMETILGSECLPKTVSDLPEHLVDGVLLAKTAQHFRPDLVPKIFEHKRLQYRHTDNIVYFFDFLNSVNMPDLFLFDMVDLYERRNLPKVIFCIHALSHILNEVDLAPEMNDLVGKLDFTADQLTSAQRGLEAAGMANQFSKVTRHFSDKLKAPPQLQLEPEKSDPEPVQELKRVVTPEASIQITEEELMLIELEANEPQIVALQARARGNLVRSKLAPIKPNQTEFIARLQACIRGATYRQDVRKQHCSVDLASLASLQAVIRGSDWRATASGQKLALEKCEQNIIAIQSMIRGHHSRRNTRYSSSKCDAADVAQMQAICRGYLQRRAVKKVDQFLASNSQLVVQLQIASRAYLARQKFARHHFQISQKGNDWTSLQAQVRGFLARSRISAKNAALREASGSIVGVQSAFRGLLQRFEIGCIIDDLDEEIVGVVGLQAMARGYMVRQQFNATVDHWYENVDKIIKLQSMWRTKTQIEAYNSLIADPNPSLSTIKHFVHLLNDNEADYQEEINLEIARKTLHSQVKSNEQLEQYIDQMDTKIALLLKNKISLDEVIQHRNEGAPTLLRRRSSAKLRTKQQQTMERINLSGGAGTHTGGAIDLRALNKSSRKRLELYQGLFYILQTQPQYLARFIDNISYGEKTHLNERDYKESVELVMTIFGNLSEDREEYFFLQLLSKAMYLDMQHMEEPNASTSNSLVWKLYNAMNRRRSVQKALSATIESTLDHIISVPSRSLECDPLVIYHNLRNEEMMQTGGQPHGDDSVSVEYAIKQPQVRSKFVSNLQLLRELVMELVDKLERGLAQMPYHTRYLAHQAYMHGCLKYDNYVGFNSMSLVGTVFVSHFLIPAIINCDSRGIVDSNLDIQQQKNLALVCKVLNTAAHFHAFDARKDPYLQPLNEFVKMCSDRLGVMFKRLIDIPDLQTMYGITNFDDVKSHQRPTLTIKTAGILGIHSKIFESMDTIADTSDNCIRPVLRQLGPLPSDSKDIIDIAKLAQVRLDLNPNYGTPVMQNTDVDAAGLMTLVKRCLIYVLRVQRGGNLLDVLVEPVEQDQEDIYTRILAEDQSSVGAKKPGELANLTYRELKLLTLEKVLELESSGRISRDNQYQELVNSLANDIRNKHELRQARIAELHTCRETLSSLQEKEIHLQNTHKTFNNYIETAMTTLQEQSQEKNRQKKVFPFSRKFFQQRDILKSGRSSRFGSYRYTATQAIEKGILIQIKGYSDRQYRDLTITFSCDTVSLFNIEVAYKGILLPGASSTISLDQLLSYQYEDQQSFDMFDDVVKFHTTRLLQYIFRKFYGATE